jgi:hypothetical protein
MRKENAVIRFARGLIDLVAEEASRNAEFSQKLDELFDSLGQKKIRNDKRTEPNEEVTTLPDIHAEWRARGETEFRFWINEQPVAALRMLIRTHELDPARRTEKWRDAEKLGSYIADQLRGRLKRGSGFMNAVLPRQGITLAISKDGEKFDACIMRSHVGERGNELGQLFRESVSLAEALRKAQELSVEKGYGGLYEISDDTSSNGDRTFSTLKAWQAAIREIDEQLGPLKDRSGLDWSSGLPITSRDLALALPLGPHIERLMLLRASIFKRRPVTL